MTRLLLAGGVLLLAALLLGVGQTMAAQGTPLHPTFPLLDEDGRNVLDSGRPVSTMRTCGGCHDTGYIAEHGLHGGDGLRSLTAAGEVAVGDGRAEMNCFLCHTAEPNEAARLAELDAGRFEWASTATLAGTSVVKQVDGGWQWQPAAFGLTGELLQASLTVQDPTNANCALCHTITDHSIGTQENSGERPLTEALVVEGCETTPWDTMTTGQLFAGQRLSDSGMNLADKEELGRSWDVHAERLVACTDCHYSLNNPIYYQEDSQSRPDHLTFDPRRLDIGDYLYRPQHEFANGQETTERACDSCHSLEGTHDWLPYKEQHAAALSCETCHISRLYAPARQSVDWTVVQADGSPVTTCRGVEEGEGTPLVSGYEPALLPRQNGDGSTSLAPYNLITSWYWAYGDEAQPVAEADLQTVWLDGTEYHPEVLALFDGDGDGRLSETELVIDSEAKERLIAGRLESLGLAEPRIAGEVQPYPISHNVTSDEWAIRSCQTCHGEDSRLAQPVSLTGQRPGGLTPDLVSDGTVQFSGQVETTTSGSLLYRPATETAGLYVLGHNSVRLIDWGGAILFLGTFVGILVHGGLRFVAARRLARRQPAMHDAYMYSIYERFWHWLQTLTILGLLFTGLVIHKPDPFGMFAFPYVVQVHNILAVILAINAALAAFYHFASGEIKQFLPRPVGLFDQLMAQAKFYLVGIFRGAEHPFTKSPQRKMNPLQQMTYLAILNILLPLQLITGTLMWGMQRWPAVAGQLGGLPFLAPFHTLIAWLFASFIVLHVYLTTTGATPLASIRAMIMGWDEVEEGHIRPQEA